MTRLVILGSSGHGVVVAEAAVESGNWSDIVFLDDNESESQVLNFSVVGDLSRLAALIDADTEVFVAIGNNERRLELLKHVETSHGIIATVVHPSAVISSSATIAVGTVICAGTIVNARAAVGLGCILNTASTIDHDCVIEDGVHVSPGANLAGGVKVGKRAWIGIGASVREGICIGQDAMVGAGAAVVSDVGDGIVVGGVPAAPLRMT